MIETLYGYCLALAIRTMLKGRTLYFFLIVSFDPLSVIEKQIETSPLSPLTLLPLYQLEQTFSLELFQLFVSKQV